VLAVPETNNRIMRRGVAKGREADIVAGVVAESAAAKRGD